MSDNLMSRRKFLVSAGTVAAAAGLVGVGLAKTPDQAAAVGTMPRGRIRRSSRTSPFPRRSHAAPTRSTTPRAARRRPGGPSVEFLAQKGDAAYTSTWATLPRNIFKFGGGGVGGWGTLCGTCNGSAAIIALCGGSSKITDEVMQYYAETPIPTNGIDKAVAVGWTATPIAPAATIPQPLPNVPTSKAHSQLCHASLSQWMMTTGKTDGSADQKDRCAKACYDMVLRTTTLLNAYFLDKTNVPAGALDPTVAGCLVGCHSGRTCPPRGRWPATPVMTRPAPVPTTTDG